MGLLHPARSLKPSHHHYPPCISHWLCIQIEIYATSMMMVMCVREHVFSSKCVHVSQSTYLCERVMCIVLSSLGCIHCPSHRSMYRWGCNYVPQWSSLCFFTAQELSRQRSVCAPWKLPAENHMAMRAIMDFSPPLRTSTPPLSPSYPFFSVFLLLSMNIWADVNRCVLLATSLFVLQHPPKLSLHFRKCMPARECTQRSVAKQWESMLMTTTVGRCFITSEDYEIQLYWQQHAVHAIYNTPFHLFLLYLLIIYVHQAACYVSFQLVAKVGVCVQI